jgi:thiol-disulfide isomerase/thioredoxin
MVLSALLIASGLNLTIEDGLLNVLPPGWSAALVAMEGQPDGQQEVGVPRTEPSAARGGATGRPDDTAAQAKLPAPLAAALPVEVALEDLGPAPDLTGIDAWINTDPLSIASLRGTVVLVEFWTFGCINCQHVQPYVNAWYDRYAASGLVVIGVHTPELSFERDLPNVRTAVATAGIRFPVAFDPSFATWNAYRNAYWPAFFFIDRTGRIRHVHFGEGDYDGSEQVIRELLAGGV